MKTKQAKDDAEKIDEEPIEPKTRARKKASDTNEEDKNKPGQGEHKTSKDTKRNPPKPRAVKKKPLGIRKTLRSKKVVIKDKVKNVIKQTVKRGRKAIVKIEPVTSHEKETVPLIPVSEIKKEPLDDIASNSRSSSPRTAGRRQRLSSDLVMMKSVLGDSPSSLVLGPRTSPYSMRSERSNSPSLFEGKNLRSGKPRKVKSNLLNEVVMKEQKKRRRLLSDSKTPDGTEISEDCKKLKRGRSCSRDGSEISKCSDVTESDVSLSETLNDTDNKELNKKLDKPKTELDVDIETNLQISTIEKVPSLNVDSKLEEHKQDVETSSIINVKKNKKQLTLKRSTSLDSDNNNSNRLKLEHLNASDIEGNLMKTENDTLLEARSSILTSMSKTFNSKEVSKNIRKARRGRKAAAASRPNPNPTSKNGITSTITNDADNMDDKQETLESLSKEIDDLINNLNENIDCDQETANNCNLTGNMAEQMQTKQVSKFYGLSKPLGDNNSIITPETPVKDKDTLTAISIDSTPSKNDDSENIRLHYEEDSTNKSTDGSKQEITYKCPAVGIDKLMDRLKEFEEFDKRRQRQEPEPKPIEPKPVMVTNDVVLINKSGTDIKPLKDIQSVISPEKPIEKENVLSCFENNSAISIVKREQVRRSIDVDLPNSVTLIKRNNLSARKESTSSNHSKESDAISIFEKSLGKDVTLTEIRKSVDKSAPITQVDLHQFATLHPNNPSPSLVGVVLDTSQISITPRVMSESKISGSDVQIVKRKSIESLSRKSSESGIDIEEKMATLEKIKSPPHVKSPAISITPTPVAVKSPEVQQPMETEALAPPLENVKPVPEDPASLTTEMSKIGSQLSLTAVHEEPKPTSAVTETPQVEKIIPEEKVEVDKKIEKMTDNKETEIKQIEMNKEIITEKSEPIITNKVTITENKDVEVENTVVAIENKVAETDNKVTATENKVTATENKVTATENRDEPCENIVAVNVNQVATSENKVVTTENKVATTENKVVTKENKVATTENKVAATENKVEEVINKVAEVDNKVEEVAKTIKSSGKSSKSARNSIECQPGPSNVLQETPESQKRKESLLRNVGLLTHKAAKEVKIEKLKEKERIYRSNYNSMLNKGKSTKSGSGDYTGTLKTVIKLNRGGGDRDKKKYRSSLKMTFQKSKNRSGKPPPDVGETASDDDAYYTIERREISTGATSDGGQRKTHYSNRLNHDVEAAPEPTEPKETLNLVIPEKASSFSIHPGRLCMDQCFYCGGKFGLFDTPCHIAQMKSSERQKKVLDNEEKLTIDSCLCDACYRHVDRRANCPSYRKRPLIKQPDAPQFTSPPDNTQSDKPVSPPLEEESEEEPPPAPPAGARAATCHTEGCACAADHSIRRKWLIKMRSSVNKVLKLQCDYPGLHTIPLCAEHYRALAPLMACALCRRRLTKHHNVQFIHHGYTDLNPLLKEAGIPVEFTERPILCKLCRYYCTLLQRPEHNAEHARNYRRRLLQVYNIEVPPEPENEQEDTNVQEDPNIIAMNKSKKKARTKTKQRKSTEPDKIAENEPSERTTESPPEEKKPEEPSNEPAKPVQHIEEDIESLISSNKILVPGAIKPAETHTQNESAEIEAMLDLETPLIPLDKQTELQYLLQKQNNPAQFLQKPANLTQKHKNILKVQNLYGIQKPGQQQRINDKNARKLQRLGQVIAQKEKTVRKDPPTDMEMFDMDKSKDGMSILKNITLNDECTIETIPNKRPTDINALKNKWQMSESFTQVKKNLSELSKKLNVVDKEPKKSTDAKYSNPVRRLETNPSISVRELFPGEEEMNLQCNIDFNNVKGVTPEGWEKCNSTIQYDVETKKLWNDLQRPYGNQSSFLRHLILLEKYFRNGDLILSQNASPHAANYNDSVQSRLRAYDNVPSNDTPRQSAISLIEFRKKPSLNGKSLLKSNQNSEESKKSRETMPPPTMFSKPKPVKVHDKTKSKTLPPELIAINTPNAQGRKAIQNVLHNIQQLVKGVSASDPTEVAASPVPIPKFEPPKEKKEAPKPETVKKQKTSKPWRPTLMPITRENLARIASEPTQVAVDGRSLPSLVQVMSSGKRYHITLQDYNKMCVMRRDKLQQIQDGGSKTKRQSTETETVVTEIQTSTLLGNGGTVLQNITPDKEAQDKKDMPDLQIGTNAATILKNVGLKNITIAPIPPKTATVTSQTLTSPMVTSPAILMTSTPLKIPQLSSAVSITSETILSPNVVMSAPMVMPNVVMPKIPKSLTVIPQTMVASIPQSVTVTAANIAPSQAVVHTPDGHRP